MKIVLGNLIEAFEAGECDMAHGANCFHTMGGGIAGAIARRYIGAAATDKSQTDYGSRSKLGTCSIAAVDRDGKNSLGSIFNMYTQYQPGNTNDSMMYWAVYSALEDAIESAKILGAHRRIGIPLVGCGIAGGEWHQIASYIDRINSRLINRQHQYVLYVLWEDHAAVKKALSITPYRIGNRYFRYSVVGLYGDEIHRDIAMVEAAGRLIPEVEIRGE